jgi:hypothetical protein
LPINYIEDEERFVETYEHWERYRGKTYTGWHRFFRKIEISWNRTGFHPTSDHRPRGMFVLTLWLGWFAERHHMEQTTTREESRIAAVLSNGKKTNKMKAVDLLATSLNRGDDKPNQELADEIIKSNRTDWVEELVANLKHKDKMIQSDCIKVLYEIGERGSASMIAPYYQTFGELLESKNNRLVWGAMYALDSISLVNPAEIFSILPAICKAIDHGSVITIDGGVSILAKLAAIKEYSETAFPLLAEQLKRCPAKQLPMYAEKSVKNIRSENRSSFVDIIRQRYLEMEKDSWKKRLDKVLKSVK